MYLISPMYFFVSQLNEDYCYRYKIVVIVIIVMLLCGMGCSEDVVL